MISKTTNFTQKLQFMLAVRAARKVFPLEEKHSHLDKYNFRDGVHCALYTVFIYLDTCHQVVMVTPLGVTR